MFRYVQNKDGYFYLQTLRYESIELTNQLLGNQQSSVQEVEGEVNDTTEASESRPHTLSKGQSNLELLGDVALEQSMINHLNAKSRKRKRNDPKPEGKKTSSVTQRRNPMTLSMPTKAEFYQQALMEVGEDNYIDEDSNSDSSCKRSNSSCKRSNSSCKDSDSSCKDSDSDDDISDN